MSVIYKGKQPERNYSIQDFNKNGVVYMGHSKFYNYDKGFPMIRAVFRSNGLLGEIRTTCYGNTLAVDVSDGWGENNCLTTECKTIREAKSILFEWFKSKGFVVPNAITDKDWRKGHLAFQDVQLKIF